MSANHEGGLGSSCFLNEECGTLLSCAGGGGGIGGKEGWLIWINVRALIIIVTEGTCSLPGWVIGCFAGAGLLLLMFLLCFCYCCCALGRKGRKLTRVASESELVIL